jgi:hypothetical protein
MVLHAAERAQLGGSTATAVATTVRLLLLLLGSLLHQDGCVVVCAPRGDLLEDGDLDDLVRLRCGTILGWTRSSKNDSLM